MRETEIKLQFPTEKLEALQFFMSKKDLTVEQELKDYLDKTYERIVPAHVREYVDSRIQQEIDQEQAPGQEAGVEDPTSTQRERRPYRRREQTAEAVPPQVQREQAAATEAEEEQGQGMNLNL